MTTARKIKGVIVVVTENLKTCLECNKNLDLKIFHRKGLYWDSRCKPCVSQHKKTQYLNKKRRKPSCYNNIIIRSYSNEIEMKINDLVSLMESFLLEECVSEQRINA
jgi:NAD-dependent SIR2 family protein deacetylase